MERLWRGGGIKDFWRNRGDELLMINNDVLLTVLICIVLYWSEEAR
jgi:hypothetical protein